MLFGKKLLHAKRILGIPSGNQLASLKYWQTLFSIDEKQLRALLLDLNILMSEKAHKLPQGAIKKLKSEAKKRKNIHQPISTKEYLPLEEPSLEILPWRTVGHKEDQILLMDVEEILKIHYALVTDFSNHYDPIDPPGPRNSDILESAVFRQTTAIGSDSKYPTIEMTGAALLHSLVHNHPFHNGNKRTALVSLLVFLDKNETLLVCREDDLFKFVLSVAQHGLIKEKYVDLADREVMAIAEWIRANSRAVEMGDRPLSLRKLKQILNKYQCEFIHSDGGNNLKIIRRKPRRGFFDRKKTLVTNIGCRNEGSEVQTRTIKKIRNELELNEENGIDSGAFYEDSPTPIDEFILRYRKTLLRLSKV